MGSMSVEPGNLEAALAAAVGHDPDLVRDLRRAFLDSAARQLDLLQRSRCDANWCYAALRLRGLAASFDNGPLFALADEAANAAPGDPVILRRLTQMIDKLAQK